MMRTVAERHRLLIVATASVMVLATGRALAAPAETPVVSPSEAIARVVARRLGGTVSVELEQVRTLVAPAPGLEAQPEPNARTGSVARFILSIADVRVGEASAIVRVRARHARATQAIDRGDALTADLIEEGEGELTAILFQRLPSSSELVGLSTRRRIASGEALTADVVEVPPQVRSGDRVEVAVNIGVVRASGSAIASGSGNVGDTIHILQHGRTRPLEARVTGPGTVEVMR